MSLACGRGREYFSRALAHSKHHKVLSGYERRQGACPCRQRRQHVPRQVREPPLLQRRTPWLHVGKMILAIQVRNRPWSPSRLWFQTSRLNHFRSRSVAPDRLETYINPALRAFCIMPPRARCGGQPTSGAGSSRKERNERWENSYQSMSIVAWI